MSAQEFRYLLTFTVTITGDEAKKETVKNAIISQLQTAKAAGNIDEADWSIRGEVIPEGGKIS